MYKAKWINRLEQFGEVNITLVLTDNKGVLPPVRIDRTYKISYESCTNKFLKDEADHLIDFYTKLANNADTNI